MTGAIVRAFLTGVVALLLGIASVVGWSSTDPPRAAPTSDGATLFGTKGCVGCHTGPDAGSMTNVGPDLRALPDVAANRRPGMSAQEYVRESILTPQAYLVPGFGSPRMPTLRLSADEAEALVSYLTRDNRG